MKKTDLRPKVGDIISYTGFDKTEYYLVLECLKRERATSYPYITCNLLHLLSGNLELHDVFYEMDYWAKVA